MAVLACSLGQDVAQQAQIRFVHRLQESDEEFPTGLEGGRRIVAYAGTTILMRKPWAA